MNNNYAKLYAETFGLTVRESSTTVKFYDDGCFIAYIDRSEPNIFNYSSNSAWSGCKVSDLALLIMNNVTVHG